MDTQETTSPAGAGAGLPAQTLIPLGQFKALLGVDSRDDGLARFALLASTVVIEGYCGRRLVRRSYREVFERSWHETFMLREYPVRAIHGVYLFGDDEALDTGMYYTIPDAGEEIDAPCSVVLSAETRSRFGFGAGLIRVRYVAGYEPGAAPADLAAACLELAAWTMGRYGGRRIGMTSNARGRGVDGERFETWIPENVRALLAPYVQRVS